MSQEATWDEYDVPPGEQIGCIAYTSPHNVPTEIRFYWTDGELLVARYRQRRSGEYREAARSRLYFRKRELPALLRAVEAALRRAGMERSGVCSR